MICASRMVWVGVFIAMAADALVGPSPRAEAGPLTVRVKVTNLAPQNGTFLTPVWVGFHNGTFDLYDPGETASEAIESLAEDGATGPLSSDFLASGAGVVDGTLSGIGPIGPGAMTFQDFVLESLAATSRYFSYASMVIPSNDTFIANGNPQAFAIFDELGNFVGADFVVLGSMVLDAGTEVNDEVPANTAFFGQAAPNTGIDQNGAVMSALGFLPAGSGGILDDPMFAGADYTASGYQIARITVTLVSAVVPEPSTLALAGLGVLGCGGVALRRRRWWRDAGAVNEGDQGS